MDKNQNKLRSSFILHLIFKKRNLDKTDVP